MAQALSTDSVSQLVHRNVPGIPWQMTGNHWVSLPSIHPDDASIHLVSLLHRGARGAVEFAGTAQHLDGARSPFLGVELEVKGRPVKLAEGGIAWERLVEWLPSFRSMVEGISVRGSIFAPHGRDADVPGVVYLLSLENRSDAEVAVSVRFRGCLGHRQLRVRTPRAFTDAHRISRSGSDVLILDGDSLPGLASLAIAAEGNVEVEVVEEGRRNISRCGPRWCCSRVKSGPPRCIWRLAQSRTAPLPPLR
jgi:hypothetical protein